MINVERRQKYSGHGRTNIINKKTIDINFDLNILNLFCSYVLSENRHIKRGGLINLRNLFDIMNLDIYRNDIEKMKRINFIKKGLEGRLLKNLNNPILIIKYINGGIIDDDLLDPQNVTLLSTDEMNWINQTVTEALNYAFIYNDIDVLQDICIRFKAADYLARGPIVKELEKIVQEMMTKFRRTRVDSETETSFTLRNGKFEEVVSDIYEELTSPSRKLLTGMQGVNELLGGGFENTRVYSFIGNTGSRKSITLLNFATQIKKYNKNYIPKDPTKIPVVVYLTMENRVNETIERLFEMEVGRGSMTQYSKEEVIRMLREEGELYLNDESPIDIIVKFVPDRSVDTGYLYTMVEDLEDEGYEVICLIQDHLKKIRSCYPQSDLRLEVGSVINEFKVFAAIKDIPVITNCHLNRDGARTIDEGLKGNKFDLTKQLGRANIGESYLILDNSDCGYIIGPEYDVNGNMYMAFKRVKSRVKATLRDYICQPFANGDSIKLVEDFYAAVPIFKESLKPDVQESNLFNNGVNSNRSKVYNNIRDIDDIMNKNDTPDIDEINIFNSDSRYRQGTTVYMNEENNNEEEPQEFAISSPASKPIKFCPFKFKNRNIA